jgi:CRISPR system Cascade subunit CasC
MLFSEDEVNEIAEILKKLAEGKSAVDVAKIKPSEIEKKMKSNPHLNITPDIALFGRMVTSDMFRDIEASIQVAHAISTHKLEHEFDYFTAVDDLSDKFEGMSEQGSAMIGEIEFTSACYYKYYVIDSDGFIANMTHGKADPKEKENAKKIFIDLIAGFIRAAIYANPSGKQNTFAAHQLPDAVLIEIKEEKIPVSYANAFLEPVLSKPNEDLMVASIKRLKKQIEDTTKIFNINSKHKIWLNTKNIDIEGTEKANNVNTLISNIEDKLKKEL